MSIAEKTGTEREENFTVEGMLMTDVGGLLETGVLSTPGMIGMMERNCALLVQEFLPEGSATVGFEVNVKHFAATPKGKPVRVRAELTGIDGRKLTFKVEAHDDEKQVGAGTHRRAIIEVKPKA
ncbi:MAG: thioesterase family protein [Solirubrobacterales bacterium]|nr:thioesterase family protein [Solirubrobacterales bacterium]